MGISLVSCTRLNHQPVPPIWKDVVFGLRELSEKEVQSFGRLSGRHESGLEFTTFTAEPVRYINSSICFWKFKSKMFHLSDFDHNIN